MPIIGHSIVLSLLFLLSATGLAATDEKEGHKHGSHAECPLPKNALDIVRCAQLQSPSVKRARLQTVQARELRSVARQIPNPDVDLQSGFLSAMGDQRSEIQIGVRQPIEWGGQRRTRILAAEAEAEVIATNETELIADVILMTVTKLHRLRQVYQEEAALLSMGEALEKLVRQQSARPALSPEQRSSLAVFRMAFADWQIRLSELYGEKRALAHDFHVSTGHSLDELKGALPPAPEKWPPVEEGHSSTESPSLLRAFADRRLAEAQMQLATSASWPSLRLGPQVTFEREGVRQNTLFGISLMMDLPIWNLNSGGRTYAAKGLLRAEKMVELKTEEERHERAEQASIYRNAVETLARSPTHSQIEKDHLENHELAKRGLIAGSLLMESYRQRNELMKGRNGRELRAIESLWRVHKFDGRIFSKAP